jgi:hypothetical protein
MTPKPKNPAAAPNSAVTFPAPAAKTAGRAKTWWSGPTTSPGGPRIPGQAGKPGAENPIAKHAGLGYGFAVSAQLNTTATI